VTTAKRPYAPPRKLEPNLARVLAYWEKLKRREAEMPFWDDVNVSALPKLLGKLTMIEACDQPVRFRFGLGAGGGEIKRKYAGDLDGKFLDEMEVQYPLQFLLSQCSATVESGKPTYYRHAGAGRGASRAKQEYSRLALPLWGLGRVGMLLVAFSWG